MTDQTSLEEVRYFEVIIKLKGESNWNQWNSQFQTALGVAGQVYVRIMSSEEHPPVQPQLFSTEEANVVTAAKKKKLECGLLFEEYGPSIEITTKNYYEMLDVINETNERMLDEHEQLTDYWSILTARALIFLLTCLGPDPKVLVARISDPQKAYNALEEEYSSAPHQLVYIQFTKFVELRYTGSNAESFVYKFNEAKSNWTEFVGPIKPEIELCFFKNAIMENPRCQHFLENLQCTDMSSIFRQFIQTEETNRMLSRQEARAALS